MANPYAQQIYKENSQAVQLSTEERMLNNERKRVESYIRDYHRDPKSWNSNMIMTLERLAIQYGIPFAKPAPSAGPIRNITATAAGALDSALALGFVPDDWYSSEATKKAANVGRAAGAVLPLAVAAAGTYLSGGTAAPLTAGIAARSMAAIRGAAGLLTKTPLAKVATGGVKQTKAALAPWAAGQGYKWAGKHVAETAKATSSGVVQAVKDAVKSGNIGSIPEIIKGANLSKQQIKTVTNQINKAYGPKSRTATEIIGGLGSTATTKIAPQILDKVISASAFNALNTEANILKYIAKSGVKVSKAESKEIVRVLLGTGKKRLVDTASDIAVIGNKLNAPLPASLYDIDKWQAGMGALGLGAAGSTAADALGAFAEEELDPYNF